MGKGGRGKHKTHNGEISHAVSLVFCLKYVVIFTYVCRAYLYNFLCSMYHSFCPSKNEFS